MSTTCRLAGTADLEHLMERLAEWHGAEGRSFDAVNARQTLQAMLADAGGGHLWLLERGEQTIGYAALTIRAPLGLLPPVAYVSALWLVPAWRGRGLGAQVRHLIHEVGRLLRVTLHEFDLQGESKHGTFLRRSPSPMPIQWARSGPDLAA